MSWRLARSLETLRDQVNAAYPNRSKVSDGTIGDSAHAGTASDHNPNAQGVVTAMDLTHDPAHGFDAHATADRLRQNRHPDLKYIISNRRIAGAWSNWQWQNYSGVNPHDKHIHVSVGVGDDGQSRPPYDDTNKWNIIGDDMNENVDYPFVANASQIILGRGKPVTQEWFNNSVEKTWTKQQLYDLWKDSEEARNFRFKGWDYDRLRKEFEDYKKANPPQGYELVNEPLYRKKV